MNYTMITIIPHSLNIPPITSTNEENMYRNTSDPSNNVIISSSQMIMRSGIMRNDNLLKLV